MQNFESFTQVEYLVIFTAILFGFVAAEFLLGWGRFIREKRFYKIHWIPILWTIFAFGLLIDIWWGSWIRGRLITNHVGYFYSSLITPLIFYLISVVLFPKPVREKKIDFKEYFYENKDWLFFLFLCFFTSNILIAYIFKESTLYDSENLFRVIAILLCLVAIKINHRYFHRLIILIAIILLAIHHTRLIIAENVSNIDSISGYTMTEYLISFYAIIFGVVSFEFFYGWGNLIRYRHQLKFNWIHLLWTIFTFGLLVDFWWISWIRGSSLISNFGYFIMLLLAPVIFHFGTVLLFPDFKNPQLKDLGKYFFEIKNVLFGVFAFYFLSNILNSFIYEEIVIYPHENFFRIIGVVFAILAIFINSIHFHKFLVIIGMVLLIVHHMIIY